MPTARPRYGHLRGAVLHFLVHGELPPPHSRAERDGQLEAFALKHRWLSRAEEPQVIDEMQTFWNLHADEITAATPQGREPWIIAALRSPEVDEDDDDGNEADEPEEGERHDRTERFNLGN